MSFTVYIEWDRSDPEDNPPADGYYSIQPEDICKDTDPAEYMSDRYGFLVESVTTVRG